MLLRSDHYQALREATDAWPGQRPAPGCLTMQMSETRPGIPLFWCGQSGEELAMLEQHLAQDRPLFGLKSTAYVMPTNNAHISVLAEHYMSEIVRLWSKGPYLLGGYCAGGMLAFEIARRLCAEGRQVAGLVIVEVSFDGIAHRVNRKASRLALHARTIKRLPPTAGVRYLGERFGLPRKQGPGRVETAAVPGHAQLRADGVFEFGSYPGDALFLFAKDGVNSRFKHPLFQRRLRAFCGEVTVRMIPGAHAVFTVPETVKALALELQNYFPSHAALDAAS